MIKEAIMKIVDKQDLTYEEAYAVMREIMSGETTPTQNSAFLAALSTKSSRAETKEEILGCATAMRELALPVPSYPGSTEIVGTGGDKSNSFNISTASSIVMAAGGVKVAKHGNRAASSKCGAADCLEALGVNIDQSPEKCMELLDQIGICFFYAQKYHTSMKYVGAIRKELGVRTVFNILGPLTNPIKPEYQVLGSYDSYLLEPLAKVLTSLGVKRGLVVHGCDVLDEISISDETIVCEFEGDEYHVYNIKPEDFGLERGKKSDIVGGLPEENAAIVNSIFDGEQGSRRNIVLMNAGAGLYAAKKAETLAEGVKLAAELIDSGAAKEKLAAYIELSNK